MIIVASNAVATTPLTHPRIFWDDIWHSAGALLTASTEEDEFPVDNVSDGLTWDFWRPTEFPAWIEVQTAAPVTIDYAFLAAHTIGTQVTTVKPQYHNGSTWVDISAAVTPADDKVLAWLFGPITATRFRFYLTGEFSPAEIPSIGVAMMGGALAMQRGPTLEFAPLTMQKRTNVRPNISEGGQTLGRSILREGLSGTLEFENLEASWVRTYFLPFMESARIRPFGWAWNPAEYPDEIALLWTPAGNSDIRPTHGGVPYLMNISFEVEGVIE